MDIAYLLLLQEIREACGGIFDDFMLQITSLGEGTITFLLLAAVYWCIDKRSGQLIALNLSIACTWNQFAKRVCRVDRPWVRDERVVPIQEAADVSEYSFPSGHTARATAVWGGHGLSLHKKNEKAVSAICWGLMFLIAFSRNYLGVHTPQDVIVAFAVGAVLVFAADKILDWVDKGKNRDVLAGIIGCILCLLPMLFAGVIPYAGTGIGFLAGWILERHFVNYQIGGTTSQRCVQFAVGAAGIIFILTVFQAAAGLVLEPEYSEILTMFMMGLYVMFGYPWVLLRKTVAVDSNIK